MKKESVYYMSYETKAFLVVLAVLILLAIAYLCFNSAYVNFNGIQVQKQLYNQLEQTGGDFKICKISDGSCLIFRRMK